MMIRETTHHGQFYKVRDYSADDAETFRSQFTEGPYTYKPEKADAVWSALAESGKGDHGWTRYEVLPTRYEFGSNVPGYLPEAEFPAVYEDFEAAKRDAIRQIREDADAAGGEVRIDHHPSGVSFCNDCGTRLVLMSDDCPYCEGSEGDAECDTCHGTGAVRDTHNCREDFAEILTALAEEVNLWSEGDNSVTVSDPSRAHDLGRAYWVRAVSEEDYAASVAYWEA